MHDSERIQPLSTNRKILYGFPEFSNSFLVFSKQVLIFYFYNVVLHLDLFYCAIALFLMVAWDAVSDPLMGRISDASRSRFGRRRSYLLWAAALIGPALVFAFSVPELGQLGLFLWMLASGIVLRTVLTILTVPYYALGAELSHDYAERSSVTGVRMVFYGLGLIASQALPIILVFAPMAGAETQNYILNNREAYPVFAVAFGALCAVIILIGFAGTRGLDKTPSGPERVQFRGFFRAALDALTNRYFRTVALCLFLAYLGFGIVQSMQLYVLNYAMSLGGKAGLLAVGGALMGSAALASPIWIILSRRFEKRSLFSAGAALFCAGMGGFFVATVTGWLTPGPAATLPVAIMGGLAGAGLSALLMIPPSMVADIAELDRLESHVPREGVYFGVLTFCTKLSIAASFLILYAGYEAIGFESPPAGVDELSAEYKAWEDHLLQSDDTLAGMRMLFGLFPAVVIILALIVNSRYPLTRAELDRRRAELAQPR